jgi:hypothetical protein
MTNENQRFEVHESDHEMHEYRRHVDAIIKAAERRFLANRGKKTGWNKPGPWDPLDRCEDELDEVRTERYEASGLPHYRTDELGDAFNFLVFGRAVEETKERLMGEDAP